MARSLRSWSSPALLAASTHVALAAVPVPFGPPPTRQPSAVRVLARKPDPGPVQEVRPEPPPPAQQLPPTPPEPQSTLPTRRVPLVRPPDAHEGAPTQNSYPTERDAAPTLELPSNPDREQTSSVTNLPPVFPTATDAVRMAPTRTTAPRSSAPKSNRAPRVDWDGYRRGLLAALLSQRRYPAMARRMGLEGVALVRIVVAPDGQLASAPKLLRSTGHALLDDEALQLVRRSAPFATLPGRPTAVQFELPVSFRLVD